jgi:hypothetical protein
LEVFACSSISPTFNVLAPTILATQTFGSSASRPCHDKRYALCAGCVNRETYTEKWWSPGGLVVVRLKACYCVRSFNLPSPGSVSTIEPASSRLTSMNSGHPTRTLPTVPTPRWHPLHASLAPLAPHAPLPWLFCPIGLNPNLLAYSTSSALVRPSPFAQFAELVLALNLP